MSQNCSILLSWLQPNAYFPDKIPSSISNSRILKELNYSKEMNKKLGLSMFSIVMTGFYDAKTNYHSCIIIDNSK